MLAQPLFAEIGIAQVVFIASVTVIAFIYAGYPALMFLLGFLFRRPVRRADISPRVSLIIAAYNEERDLKAKLENALALDYPHDRLEIIVASDCSSDRTDEIARSFSDRGVILYRQPERFGKTVAQNRAVRISSGEILVFSDATTIYEPDVLRKLVRNFADPEVGCVAGQLVYVDGKASAVGKGCRSYWGYEKFLKRCESQVGSLIGVSGCLYAVRRSCHARLANDMIDDFVIATEIHLQDLRTVYEPQAIACEDTNHRTKDEFRMRVRVIKQTMSALHRYREVLNPARHGMFAVQLIAHKLLRYGVWVPLIAAFIANGLAWDSAEWCRLAFFGQVALYSVAVIGWVAERLKIKIGPLAIPYYFVLVNAASLMAFLKALYGEAYVVWEPIREARSSSPGAKAASGSQN
jgi:cellulose synthase/poly-beta-1,6-N-acetylglucosamine synthase-like glycosyltransferase